MTAQLIVALLLATAGDLRFELTVQGDPAAQIAVRAADDGACVLKLAEQSAQWRLVHGETDEAAGPAAYVPGRAQTHVEVLVAGTTVIAVLHDKLGGRLLAKVAGKCVRTSGTVTVTGGSRIVGRRDIAMCKSITFGEPAYFVGEVTTPGKLVVLEQGQVSRVRFTADDLAKLSCKNIPVESVTADLPWRYEDLAFLKEEQSFSSSGKITAKPGYWSPEMISTKLIALAAAHPKDARLVTIATSRQGKAVLALAIGTNVVADDPRPAMLLNGGHHGDELLSTSVVMDAATALLEDKTLRKMRDRLVVWCVPIVNPDGLDLFLHTSVRAGRKNGNDADGDGQRGVHDGVDLNRNYPFGWRTTASAGASGAEPLSRMYPGTGAGSEPETQGIMELAARERFVASVSYHMGTVALLAPYTMSGVTDPEPNEALAVAEDVARALPPHPEGKSFVVKKRLYEVDGTDQDWHRFAQGTVALLAEIGTWPPPQDAKKRDSIVRFGAQIWKGLAKRFLDGPSLTIRSFATVTIDGQKLGNGERWTPRPRDGLTARFVTAPGPHVLRFELEDKTWERTVTVGEKSLAISE